MIHEHEHHEEHSHEHEESTSWWQPLLSLALLLAGIVMNATGVEWFQNRWVQLAWYALAWLPTGLGVLREAIEAVHEGEIFNEFMLMAVASIGAFAIGEYPEAVAVMTLYCIGEALQDSAVSRARGTIKSLIAFRPDHAIVIRDNAPETIPVVYRHSGETQHRRIAAACTRIDPSLSVIRTDLPLILQSHSLRC